MLILYLGLESVSEITVGGRSSREELVLDGCECDSKEESGEEGKTGLKGATGKKAEGEGEGQG